MQKAPIRNAPKCSLTGSVRPNTSYIDSHKRKKLIDVLAAGEAPADVYRASKVDSVEVRTDMESASPIRYSLQVEGKLP